MCVFTQYNNPDKAPNYIYIYFVSSYIHVTSHTNSSRSKVIRIIPIYYTRNKWNIIDICDVACAKINSWLLYFK